MFWTGTQRELERRARPNLPEIRLYWPRPGERKIGSWSTRTAVFGGRIAKHAKYFWGFLSLKEQIYEIAIDS